jgi:hypothetical protein
LLAKELGKSIGQGIFVCVNCVAILLVVLGFVYRNCKQQSRLWHAPQGGIKIDKNLKLGQRKSIQGANSDPCQLKFIKLQVY